VRILARGGRIFKDSIARFTRSNCLALSAAISFFAMFSLFPLSMLTLSLVVRAVGSSEVAMSRMQSIVSNLTPVGAGVIMSWVQSAGRSRPLVLGIGVLATIWGARYAFATLASSASVIHGRKGWMDVLVRQVLSLVLVGFTALMLLISVFLPTLVERLRQQAGVAIGDFLGTCLACVPYVLSFLTFSTIYLLTSPRHVPRKHVLAVAAIVSFIWEVAKTAFLQYLGFTRLASFYGSIGSMMALMVWIYWSAVIVLWGMTVIASITEKHKEIKHLRRNTGVLVLD
jgi:membrane protein